VRKPIERALVEDRARLVQPRNGDADVVVGRECALDQCVEHGILELAPPASVERLR
jgi:hypothetical protein